MNKRICVCISIVWYSRRHSTTSPQLLTGDFSTMTEVNRIQSELTIELTSGMESNYEGYRYFCCVSLFNGTVLRDSLEYFLFPRSVFMSVLDYPIYDENAALSAQTEKCIDPTAISYGRPLISCSYSTTPPTMTPLPVIPPFMTPPPTTPPPTMPLSITPPSTFNDHSTYDTPSNSTTSNSTTLPTMTPLPMTPPLTIPPPTTPLPTMSLSITPPSTSNDHSTYDTPSNNSCTNDTPSCNPSTHTTPSNDPSNVHSR